MSEALFPYYERELLFLRQLTQEFARQYPSAGARLLLEPDRSADPHVERILESFALLTGRVHQKLDDEFPELTEAMLGVLYPHYLAPIPSLATLQFDLDPGRAELPRGFVLPRGSRLHTQPINNLQGKFRTAYPVTLWPIRLANARLQSPPFPPGLQVPARTAAALRFQFECVGPLKFSDLALETLRLLLVADIQHVPLLYELIFNHAIQVVFRPLEPETSPAPVILPPEQVLKQVGFERDESLLPYPSRARLGYQLLTEFFALPGKFLYLDLGGWQRVARAGFQKRLEVVVFLDRTFKAVEQVVDTGTFRLGCTPVVNLFEMATEPIALKPNCYEYRVIPDAAYPQGYEVYSIDSVTSTDPSSNSTTEYLPFHSIRHDVGSEEPRTFWYATRRRSSTPGDAGTDVYLRLVDLGFQPQLPNDQTLTVRTTCSNRDLLTQLQEQGEQVNFELEGAAPLSRIHCLRPPTAVIRPSQGRGGAWRRVSHLNLNPLSLSDPVEGLEAFKDILRLYDFSSGEELRQQVAAILRQLVDGIVAMKTRPVIGRTKENNSGFTRGVEVLLEFDEEKYQGTGVLLFASVLERFLGLYVSGNSFSQLIGKLKQSKQPFKRWAPRAGEMNLI